MSADEDRPWPDSDTLARGTPSIEHVIFVVLGMLAMFAVMLHLYLVFTG